MAILAWFLTPRGALVAAFGVMLIAWQIDRTAVAWRSEKKGAANAVAKIEKATTNAIKKADAAGRKSAAGGGVRNPHYRD